jgi:hypothetical protein
MIMNVKDRQAGSSGNALICILEVPGSDLVRETNYPDRDFVDFLYSGGARFESCPRPRLYEAFLGFPKYTKKVLGLVS